MQNDIEWRATASLGQDNAAPYIGNYPYLHVVFDAAINPEDLAAVRGAIVKRVGREYDLFHNHKAGGEKNHRYPLIQYKRFGDQPGLICIGQGVEEVQAYLALQDRQIRIGERQFQMNIEHLNVRNLKLRAWSNFFSYRLKNWIALHGEHLESYKHEPRLAGRLMLLERKLNSNIRSFTRALGWTGDGQVEVRIHHIRNAGHVPLKDIQFRAFDIEFSTNIMLPYHIGLGKGAAFGYGIVQPNFSKA